MSVPTDKRRRADHRVYALEVDVHVNQDPTVLEGATPNASRPTHGADRPR
ncbi:hypothetical protein [Rubrivirga sp.]